MFPYKSITLTTELLKTEKFQVKSVQKIRQQYSSQLAVRHSYELLRILFAKLIPDSKLLKSVHRTSSSERNSNKLQFTIHRVQQILQSIPDIPSNREINPTIEVQMHLQYQFFTEVMDISPSSDLL